MTDLPSIEKIAAVLGGSVSGREALVPGPGHSAVDRSLSIKLDVEAPDGFVLHSFAGDDAIACQFCALTRTGVGLGVRKSRIDDTAPRTARQRE
jgi:hypothetical protein